MDILHEGVIGIFWMICSTIDIMVRYAPGITVNDETHGQLEQLSVCLFFYVIEKLGLIYKYSYLYDMEKFTLQYDRIMLLRKLYKRTWRDNNNFIKYFTQMKERKT